MRWLESIGEWLGSAEARNFGGFLSGIAAVIGVVYAALSFRSWRHRRVAEARATAAARALPALEAFARSVSLWMDTFAVAAFETRGLGGDEAMDRITDLTKDVRAVVEARQKDLAASGAEAAAVLTDKELAPLGVTNTVFSTWGSRFGREPEAKLSGGSKRRRSDVIRRPWNSTMSWAVRCVI